MRIGFSVLFCLVIMSGLAQKMQPYPSSDNIVITGLVKQPTAIAVSTLNNIADTSFPSLKILNHRGDFKANYLTVKAVALKKIIEDNLALSTKPKEMLSLYFVCKAMDGYTVVYSYNELFNDPSNIFIITQYDNLDISNMPEKPMLLTLTAAATGKIGLRGLKSIEVKKRIDIEFMRAALRPLL